MFYSNTKTLYAVYDLAVSPITFDVLNFTTMAEIFRSALKLDYVHFVYLLGPNRSFRNQTPKDKNLSDEQKHWRLRQILVPQSWLLSSCNGCSVFLDREEGARFLAQIPPVNIFPGNYHVSRPTWSFMISAINEVARRNEVDALRFQATPTALQYVDEWCVRNGVGGPLVTFTVRVSDIEAHRNSNLSAWTRLAKEIKAEGYCPVFLTDTDVALRANRADFASELLVNWVGPVNLEIRTALYQRSYISMSQSGGPAFINFFMKDSIYAGFQPVNAIPEVFSKETGTGEGLAGMERVFGIKAGDLFAFSNPGQKLVWEPDSYNNIRKVFNELVEHRAVSPLPSGIPQ